MKKFPLTSWKVRKGHKVVSQISALFSEKNAKKCLFLTFFQFPVLLILSNRGANRGVNVGRKGFPYRI